MGRNLDESTLRALEYIYECYIKGCPVPINEVAKKFNRDPSTLYKSLKRLEDKYGISREDFLFHPHSEHMTYDREFEPVKPLDITGYRQSFEEALNAMDKTQTIMENAIEMIMLLEEEGDL